MSPSWASGWRLGDWRLSLQALGDMLNPPRECVAIEFLADRVVATRLDRKRQPAFRREATAEAPAADAPGWRGALHALESLLAERDFREASAEIVVSNHFLRYAMVPWRDDVTGDAERQAWVRHTLNRLYGIHAEGWEVCLALGRHGAASLAAAIEPELLAALRAASRTAGLVLQSVEPLLVAGFNRVCADLGPASFWFASVEAGRACLVRIQDGEWQGVRCQRLGHDWQAELPVILARESLLEVGPAAGLPVYVHVPAPQGGGFVSGQWVAGGLRVAGTVPPPGGRRRVAKTPAEAQS